MDHLGSRLRKACLSIAEKNELNVVPLVPLRGLPLLSKILIEELTVLT